MYIEYYEILRGAKLSFGAHRHSYRCKHHLILRRTQLIHDHDEGLLFWQIVHTDLIIERLFKVFRVCNVYRVRTDLWHHIQA